VGADARFSESTRQTLLEQIANGLYYSGACHGGQVPPMHRGGGAAHVPRRGHDCHLSRDHGAPELSVVADWED
jgi:hypothetical protein